MPFRRGSRSASLASPISAEERVPLLVGIDQRADIAVAGLVGAAIGRQQPRIAGRPDRRIETAAGHVIAEHESRHGLEHRDFDRLSFAGAFAVEQRGEDGVQRIEPDDAVGHRRRRIARLAGDLAGQRRQRRQALDQVVVSGPSGIGAGLAKAVQAGIDQPRVDREQIVGAELEASHRRRPHIVHEHVGVRRQPEQGGAATGLLQVEHDRALVAVALQVHRAHLGMAHRCCEPHDVAVGAFDLDDVGAVVAEDHGRVGTHHHAGEIDDPDAGERSRRRRKRWR